MKAFVLAFLSLAACGGQNNLRPADAPARSPTALATLVKHESALGVSPEQLTQLQDISRKLDEMNGPLDREVEELETLDQKATERRAQSGGRGAMRKPPSPQARATRDQRMADAVMIRERMVGNHGRALAEALCVLDADQRKRAIKIIDDEGYTTPQTLPCE